MSKKWKCTVCGYIHEGDGPPDTCPVCGAFKYQFILYETLPKALEKRLREAFAAESKASIRNQAFAKKAEEEEFPQIAR
ncbi:MAG: rubredoxin-like domain-containing protein, partial [Pseudomonadota bacterium]